MIEIILSCVSFIAGFTCLYVYTTTEIEIYKRGYKLETENPVGYMATGLVLLLAAVAFAI